MQIYYLILYFFTYGLLGWCTEVAYAAVRQGKFVNRGFLNGPICPIYGVGVSVVIYFLMPLSGSLALLYAASAVLVTVLEGITGYLMERLFHHKWWDYSDQPLNIGGYVCLIFSLVWGVACVFIVRVFHPLIHKLLALIPFAAGVVLCAGLMVVLFADLYVTASGILKLNRQLETMERIAGELKELSDKLGETIYENVMETMEIREEGLKRISDAAAGRKERFEEITSEQRQRTRARLLELHERYEAVSRERSRVAGRLMNAFPRMESRRHKMLLEELKKRMKNRM
ncbi:hypothetical protein AALC75_18555 [Lachnospiraceae bacterium 48-42]|nr:hypothetical protein [Dorea sp.]